MQLLRLAASAVVVSHALGASAPFCGTSTARGADVLVLKCADGAGAIAGFDFASYGTPSGSCADNNLAVNASCNWTAAWAAQAHSVNGEGAPAGAAGASPAAMHAFAISGESDDEHEGASLTGKARRV